MTSVWLKTEAVFSGVARDLLFEKMIVTERDAVQRSS